MKVNKKQVIKLLETIGLFMELKGANPFKISAFRKAAAALESDDRSLSEIEDFTKIPGIGKGTAAVIQEYIEAGTSEVLEELEKEVPSSLLPLLKLPGLGGKKVAKLYKELGIIDMETLQRACEENKVQVLAGFGKKTEEKILEAIAQVGSRPERLPIAMVLPIAGEIEEKLSNIQEIVRFSRAGSLRRVRETVKDLDFIIATTEPAAVREHLLQFDNMIEVIASGDTKVSVRLQYEYDISIDFRLVKPEEFITTLHHFTGSKDHNVRMRQIAKDKGEKISEYGVENLETGEVKTFETEEAFFAHFGLPFIPPEVREDGKEVELIKEYPNLIQFSDIQGDLHMHTTWSDGAFSIEEMVQACRGRGYKFMAITDHSQYLKVANGLTKERLREQGKEIERINEKYPDITILRGIEMDILPDATLDFDDEVLAELDYVIGAIHSSFSQDRETIMKRLRTAIENKHVTMIAHPTGRLLGRREGYDVDTDLLIELAKETDTVLELNANPNRLDLSAKLLKQAQDAGVKVAINTDAHTLEMLEDMETGVAAARKGWIQKDTVINTWDIKRLLDFIKRNK
ncbi:MULTISPECIES: DNA polymerase/3'-5' exonuclease PolX [Bacillus]|uniref:DNA polymerase/3'-5' exonuclease PolX n=1 Tax=Bacillus TaxID=1386 RepID=UPI0001A183C6|nr:MULTISPECIES: DNA polymerase/3'-5' exonuclease PolX [Bacillus]AIK37043.1 DNA polymerase/3'-5' exonuclease PolX [Bacillus pseudomycoides]AJI19966.1 DNA polymerase/3'-5' exonuclease PolX [Bacillus pseudomycoides]EEM14987.1 PHP C-terminal domain protein [Bacillus pseudomycoides DSM 12442]MEB3055388.1 DNA polymerase/3'-5' exonuclease PolX [Bacillus pseudomycoides]MED1595989.1 DNA polymerase/3'-5' exonuclease PolX [Bacillus pseudomycoides]